MKTFFAAAIVVVAFASFSVGCMVQPSDQISPLDTPSDKTANIPHQDPNGYPLAEQETKVKPVPLFITCTSNADCKDPTNPSNHCKVHFTTRYDSVRNICNAIDIMESKCVSGGPIDPLQTCESGISDYWGPANYIDLCDSDADCRGMVSWVGGRPVKDPSTPLIVADGMCCPTAKAFGMKYCATKCELQ